jgi:uncharacterized protein
VLPCLNVLYLTFSNSTMKPTAGRIHELDLLRGYALWGILCINVQVFSYSISLEAEWVQTFRDPLNSIVIQSSFLLAAQRFVGLFSLLFGLGVAIQQQHYKAAGIPFSFHYLIRILMLAVFGLINFAFFFWGDILFIYSLLALLLFACFRLPNRVLIFLALIVFGLSRHLLLIPSVEGLFLPLRESFAAQYPASVLIQTYQSGSVADMMQLRISEFVAYTLTEFAWIRTAFAMMIIGYVIGRNNWHITYTKHLPKIRIAFWIVAPLCLTYIVYNFYDFVFFIPTNGHIILSDLFILCSLFVYIGFVLWIFRFSFMQKLKTVISNIGRLSLSNYFLQQIICAFIFHSYGLGLYFKTTPVYNLVIVMLIYVFQVWLTHVYLKRFNTGPLEWIWRKISAVNR